MARFADEELTFRKIGTGIPISRMVACACTIHWHCRRDGGLMRWTVSVVASTLLTTFPVAIHASDPSPAPSPIFAATPDAVALARQVVDDFDARSQFSKALAPLEGMLTQSAMGNLAAKDDATRSKVRDAIHGAFEPIGTEYVDALASAYASGSSIRELSFVDRFMKGPTGQTLAQNSPLLKEQFTGVFQMSDADIATLEENANRQFANLPQARKDLILRIFKAQDLERKTRDGYREVVNMMSKMIESDGNPVSEADKHKIDQAVDNYTQATMAIEKSFHADHYTDAELAAMADYLESSESQAFLARLPMVKHSVGERVIGRIVEVFGSFDKTVCSAVPCTPDEQRKMAESAVGMQKMGPALNKLLP